MSFCDPEDVVLKVSSCGSWILMSALALNWIRLYIIPHISLCLRTSLSSIVTNAFFVTVSCSIWTNGGIVMDSEPSGPSTLTVGLSCSGDGRAFFGAVG